MTQAIKLSLFFLCMLCPLKSLGMAHKKQNKLKSKAKLAIALQRERKPKALSGTLALPEKIAILTLEKLDKFKKQFNEQATHMWKNRRVHRARYVKDIPADDPRVIVIDGKKWEVDTEELFVNLFTDLYLTEYQKAFKKAANEKEARSEAQACYNRLQPCCIQPCCTIL